MNIDNSHFLSANNIKIKPIVSFEQNNQIHWNFIHFDQNKSIIDCVMVQNNIQMNFQWLRKSISQTQNILLADGGANIYYQNGFRQYSKIKGIIGDLDSLKSQIRSNFKKNNVPIIKIEDQNKNDFQKTLLYAINQLGLKNIFVFGALGGRFDHTLATMSIAQKFMKQYSKVHLTLIGKTNLICLLKGGIKHRISVSKDLDSQGSKLISFQKAQNVQTTGFKWNMGKDKDFGELKWGNFLSTSNSIADKQISVYTPTLNATINFISHFKGSI